MESIVRSVKFNYNPDYTGPRFYTFSTWADDITKYYMSSSGAIVAPAAFLALNINKPVSEIIPVLENYFENKLAAIRKKYFANEECDYDLFTKVSNFYSPLYYLLDSFKYLGIIDNDTRWILEPIVEQNYNGSFTDILCTIPHGVYAKNIDSNLISLISNDNWERPEDTIDTVGIIESDIKDYDGTPFRKLGKFPSAFNWAAAAENELSEDGTRYETTVTANGYNFTFYQLRPKEFSKDENNVRYCLWSSVDKLEFNSGEQILIKGDTGKISKITITGAGTGKVLLRTKNTITKSWSDAGIIECYFERTMRSSEVLIEFTGDCLIESINIDNTITEYHEVSGPVIIKDRPVGWSTDSEIIYDYWDSETETGKYDYDIKENRLVFSDTDDTDFTFNCIIPLYKIYNNEINTIKISNSDNELNLCELSPFGIWFNELETSGENAGLPYSVKVKTGAGNNKYTSSWSLSISTQIKPYYASNSVPVKYSSNTDYESAFNTFASVISKVKDLSAGIKTSQTQIGSVQYMDTDLSVLSEDIVGIMKRLIDLENRSDDNRLQILEERINKIYDKLCLQEPSE